MGFIADLARQKNTPSEAVEAGRQMWRQTFGGISKEDFNKQPPVRPKPGGSYGTGILSEGNSYKRLLQAMRSMAPGGWSDDRMEETGHWEGIQYIAGHRLCTMIGQAEFQVFEKDPKHPDGKVAARSKEGEALIRLLERPNNQDSFGQWMYRLYQQKLLTGTALDWLVPNRLGVPCEHYIVPTAIAVPQPAINPDFPDGFYRIQPVYPYGPFSSYPTPNSAVGAPIPAQWMLRFQYPHPLLRYEGFSPLTGLRLHIDEVTQIDRSRNYSMMREWAPSMALDMTSVEGAEPWQEAELERMMAEFENQHQGPENAGKIFIPPPGAKISELGKTGREMEYANSWKQLVDFVMAGFGITKPAAGMIEDSSYSTLFATLKQVYLMTLQPECDDIASGLTRHLAPYFAEGLIVEVRCKRIDDHELINGKINTLMAAKALTKNEARKLLDMPVTKEAWGEEIAGSESGGAGAPGGLGGDLGGLGGIPDLGGIGGGVPGGEGAEGGLPDLGDFTGPGEGPGGQPPPGAEDNAAVPDTGTLGEGALGPRKSLNKRLDYLQDWRGSLGGRLKDLRPKRPLKKKTKALPKSPVKSLPPSISLYDQVRAACKNGNNGHYSPKEEGLR